MADFIQEAMAKAKQAKDAYAGQFEAPTLEAPALSFSGDTAEVAGLDSGTPSVEARGDIEAVEELQGNEELAGVLLDNTTLENIAGGVSQAWNKAINRTENNAAVHAVRDRVNQGGDTFTDDELTQVLDAQREVPYAAGLGWMNALPDATAIVGDIAEQTVEGGGLTALAAGTTAFAARRLGVTVDPFKVMSLGGSAGVGYVEFENQVAEQFLSLSMATDVKGNKIDPKAAATGAVFVAGINTAVEVVGLNVVARAFPGAKKLSAFKNNQWGAKIANTPRAQQILKQLNADTLTADLLKGVVSVGATVAAEGTTELLQELSAILSESYYLDNTLDREVGKDLMTAAQSPVAGMLLLSATANSVDVGRKSLKRRKNAGTNKKTTEAFVDGVVVDLKQYQREEVADRLNISEAADVSSKLGIDQQAARKLFQKEDGTPDEKLKEAFPELVQAIDSADGDAARSVDLSDNLVATQLVEVAEQQGRTDELKGELTYGDAMPSSYFDVDEDNIPGFEEDKATTDENVREPAEPEATARQNFLSELAQINGVEYAQATTKLLDKFFDQLAVDSGFTVEQLWEENAIKLQREGVGQNKKGVTQLTAMIHQLRRGKEVSDKDMFGESVVDFIRRQGGVADVDITTRFGQTLGAAPTLSLDAIAERLYEEGFPVPKDDRSNTSVVRWTPEMVYAEIEAELTLGQRNVRGDSFNEPAIRRKELTDALAARFEELGVDYSSTNFDQVYDAFVQAELKQVVAQGFESEWLTKEDLKNRKLNQTSDASGKVKGFTEFDEQQLDGFVIKVTKNADRSTVIHEVAHVMLAILNDHAKDNEAIAADMKAISGWAGFNPGESIPTDAHEKFARGFEKYLMQGKSPVAELARVFEKFKNWMLKIYSTKAMRSKLELNPEASEFFDRMLGAKSASDASAYDLSWGSVEQVNALMELLGEQPGIIAAEARAEAEAYVRAQVMRDLKKQTESERKSKREKITEEVTAQVDKEYLEDKVTGLLSYFATGETRLPALFGENPKFNRINVQQHFNSAVGVQGMQRLMTKAADSDLAGYTLAEVADTYGFESVDAMVHALTTAPKKSELAAARVRARMTEDMLDIDLDAEADLIMADKAQEVLLHAYTRTYGKRKGKRAVSVKAMASQIREAVRDTKLADVTADKYFRNYQKQIRAFTDAVKDKNVDDALEATRESFLALEEYKEARRVVKLKDSMNRKFRRYSKKSMSEMLRKAGRNLDNNTLYYDALHSLLGKFDASYVTKKSIQQSNAAQQLRNMMQEDGRDIAYVAQTQEFEVANLLELTAEQVDTLFNAADSIVKLAREQYGNDREAKVEQVKATNAALESEVKKNRTKRDYGTFGNLFESFAGAVMKSSSLMAEFDGGKPGVWFDTFIQPLADAGVAQLEMLKSPEAKMQAAVDEYKKSKRFEGQDGWLPAANALSRKVTFLGEQRPMSEIISIALNMGTATSQAKFEQGYTALEGYESWSIDNVLRELDGLMEREDWALVESIWAAYDEVKSPLKKFTETVLTAKFNEEGGTDINTRHGVIKGKYYPIVYDVELTKANRRELAAAMDGNKSAIDSITHAVDPKTAMEALQGQTLMSTGVTKGRTKAFAPISLDLNNAPKQLRETVHLITHYDAVYNALMRYNDNKDLIINYAGANRAKAMENMLFGVAREERREKTATEYAFGRFVEDRVASGLTIASIGLSLTTIVKQPLGLISAAADVPPKYILGGLSSMAAKGFEQTEKEVHAKSGYMRNYEANFNVDIAEELQKMQDNYAERGASALRENAFFGIAYVQKRVSTVVWVGAYNQAMDMYNGNEARAIKYADHAVRETQGSGDIYNQANFQRWGGLRAPWRLFSTFISVMTTAYIKRIERGTTDAKSARDAFDAAVDVFIIAALMPLAESAGTVLYNAMLGEDEEDLADVWLAKSVGGTVGVIPGVGSMITGMLFYGDARDPVSQIVNTSKDAVDAVVEGEFDKRGVKSIIRSIGVAAKLPTKPIEQFVDITWDD